MQICVQSSSHHYTCLWSGPPSSDGPHHTEDSPARRTGHPLFGSHYLSVHPPSPFLLGPQRGNFPHFHPLMLFPPLKCPSRPHPLERSAKPRRQLLPPLGVTTFPSPPGPDHTAPAPPEPGAPGGPPYTSPEVRPSRPSSRRPGTLPGPVPKASFRRKLWAQHAGRRRAARPERSESSVRRMARTRPQETQVHRDASYPNPADRPGSARTPRPHGPGRAADPFQDAPAGGGSRSSRRPQGPRSAPAPRAAPKPPAPAPPRPPAPRGPLRPSAVSRGPREGGRGWRPRRRFARSGKTQPSTSAPSCAAPPPGPSRWPPGRGREPPTISASGAGAQAVGGAVTSAEGM